MARYAVINRDNIVINVIELDPYANYEWDRDCTYIQSDIASPGDVYAFVDNEFHRQPPETTINQANDVTVDRLTELQLRLDILEANMDSVLSDQATISGRLADITEERLPPTEEEL